MIGSEISSVKRRGRKQAAVEKYPVNIMLPKDVFDQLSILAGLSRTSKTQIVIGLIKDEAMRKEEKIRMYKELIDEN